MAPVVPSPGTSTDSYGGARFTRGSTGPPARPYRHLNQQIPGDILPLRCTEDVRSSRTRGRILGHQHLPNPALCASVCRRCWRVRAATSFRAVVVRDSIECKSYKRFRDPREYCTDDKSPEAAGLSALLFGEAPPPREDRVAGGSRFRVSPTPPWACCYTGGSRFCYFPYTSFFLSSWAHGYSCLCHPLIQLLLPLAWALRVFLHCEVSVLSNFWATLVLFARTMLSPSRVGQHLFRVRCWF
ncbi:hypothetical protein B0H19DRAFT_1101208 [Mycena capillaripes]|nr:hypothetical protein B0H19DRAFT_1101208 [Mycena capillaripes]